MAISFDGLSSSDFEGFCADLLNETGFVNVDWRKGTGLATSPADKGRDIAKTSKEAFHRRTYRTCWHGPKPNGLFPRSGRRVAYSITRSLRCRTIGVIWHSRMGFPALPLLSAAAELFVVNLVT
jgi:hypothetical protein